MKKVWLVWGVGVFAYVIAVLHRTSFGVSGLSAADRFSISPSVLSSFVVLQIVVYAGMQIPAGVLLDRYGSRIMIAVGAFIMMSAQLALAFTESLPVAIGARIAVGAGDALTFISVLRLVPQWFPPRQVPLVSQFTGILGQLGQVMSALPFMLLLSGPGWTFAYGSAAAVGLLAFALALSVIRDAPPGADVVAVPAGAKEIGRQIKTVWMRPGTDSGSSAHGDSVLDHDVRAAVGCAVPEIGSRPRLHDGRLAADAVSHLGNRGRPDPRYSHRSLSHASIVVGSHHHGGERAHVDDRAFTKRTVSALVVDDPGGRHLGGWAGFGDRLRLRAHIQSEFGDGHRPGHGQHRGIPRFPHRDSSDGRHPRAHGGYTFDGFRVAWMVQYPVWILGIVGVLVTRGKARRALAAEGVHVRPIREVIRRNK